MTDFERDQKIVNKAIEKLKQSIYFSRHAPYNRSLYIFDNIKIENFNGDCISIVHNFKDVYSGYLGEMFEKHPTPEQKLANRLMDALHDAINRIEDNNKINFLES